MKSDNRLLVEKIKNLEDHQEVLIRKHIKEQEKTKKVKNNGNKISNAANKSIQVEQNIISTKSMQSIEEYPISINDTNISRQRDKTEASDLLQLELSINTKLAEFSTSILDSVSEIIDKKIDEMEKNLKSIPENLTKKCENYAQVLMTNLPETSEIAAKSNMQNIKTILKEAITEKKKDEKDIEDRKKNIILFNVPESHADTAEKRKNEDISFFTNMHNTICENNLTGNIIARRLGKHPEDDSKRPLLITVDSEITKRKLFSRLYRMKDNEPYTNINVSHDMTKDERKQTKILVEKAKNQTRELASKEEET